MFAVRGIVAACGLLFLPHFREGELVAPGIIAAECEL